MPRTLYVSTAIPYVNAPPHLGFALEMVLADALARHARARGERVHFVSGTDENSLSNVRAADAAGIPVRELVPFLPTTAQAILEALAAPERPAPILFPKRDLEDRDSPRSLS